MINALRRTFVRKRNIKGKVEPHAGATRSVQERIKLLDNPLTYCFDTPGITTPSVGEVGTQRWKKLEGPLHRCECSFGRIMLVLILPCVNWYTESTMRLAACGCLKDADIGLDVIVDYLLYYLNKR